MGGRGQGDVWMKTCGVDCGAAGGTRRARPARSLCRRPMPHWAACVGPRRAPAVTISDHHRHGSGGLVQARHGDHQGEPVPVAPPHADLRESGGDRPASGVGAPPSIADVRTPGAALLRHWGKHRPKRPTVQRRRVYRRCGPLASSDDGLGRLNVLLRLSSDGSPTKAASDGRSPAPFLPSTRPSNKKTNKITPSDDTDDSDDVAGGWAMKSVRRKFTTRSVRGCLREVGSLCLRPHRHPCTRRGVCRRLKDFGAKIQASRASLNPEAGSPPSLDQVLPHRRWNAHPPHMLLRTG